MQGFPNHLNTLVDFDNCQQMALAGQLDRAILAQKYQNLLDNRQAWVSHEIVAPDYETEDGERVITEDRDGETVHTLQRLEDDPASLFARVGLSEAEIQARMAELTG